ncbi:MAG: Imm51 family immunity protein [Bacteroidota bacterium]
MNPKTSLLILATFFVFGQSCSQDNKTNKSLAHKDTSTVKPNSAMTNYFPFTISTSEGKFIIQAATESPELYPTYAEVFARNEYSGNGYSWEGHIIQILEKLNPALLQHIEFDPEAGSFFCYADTKENQLKFVEILSPIFADLKKLEEYIKKANRTRIDD